MTKQDPTEILRVALREIADTDTRRKGFARWASERAQRALDEESPAEAGPTVPSAKDVTEG